MPCSLWSPPPGWSSAAAVRLIPTFCWATPRTPYCDRVDFIYELTPADLPALFRLARIFVYLPDADAEASIVPVVEALRAGCRWC